MSVMLAPNDLLGSAELATASRDGESGHRSSSRRLRSQLQALQRERDELAGRLAEWEEHRPHLENLANEHAELFQWRLENEPRLAEVDELRARAALPPDEAQRRLEELQGRWRQKVHEDGFRNALASVPGDDGKAYTLHPDAWPETLWREIGYQPDTDEPDPDRLGEAAKQALRAMPYAFREADPTARGANRDRDSRSSTQRRTMPPGPGASRAITGQDTDDLTVSPAQLRDPVFMHALQKRLERDPEARERFRIRPG